MQVSFACSLLGSKVSLGTFIFIYINRFIHSSFLHSSIAWSTIIHVRTLTTFPCMLVKKQFKMTHTSTRDYISRHTVQLDHHRINNQQYVKNYPMDNDSIFVDDNNNHHNATQSFQNLHAIVSSLGFDHARLIPSNYSPSEIEKEVESMSMNRDARSNSRRHKSKIVHIKSLIFEITWIDSSQFMDISSSENITMIQKDYIVVILPENQRVDIDKLSTVIIESKEIFFNNSLLQQQNVQLQTIQLAPTSLLQNITGFEVGTIPPIGHSFITSIFDQQLIQDEKNLDEPIFILGGAGNIHWNLLLRLNKQDCLTPPPPSHGGTYLYKDISDNQQTKVTTSTQDYIIRSEPVSILPRQSRNTTYKGIKPYFPICPPPLLLSSSSSSSFMDVGVNDTTSTTTTTIQNAVTVTFVGTLTNVRQIAKTLAFCDIAPPMIPYGQEDESIQYYMNMNNNNNASISDLLLPWVSGTDGKEMSVQIIMGKTLCMNIGDVEGAKVIKALRVGQDIVVTGNINILSLSSSSQGNLSYTTTSITTSKPSSSMIHWIEKRCLDISVISFITLPKRVYRYNHSPSFRDSSSSIQHVNGISKKDNVHIDDSLSQSQADRPLLRMEDVFGSSFSIQIIDSMDTISSFIHAVQSLISDPTYYDLVGMDCEWQPSGLYSSSIDENPVALLQVCLYSQQKIFLLDLLSLLRHHQDKESALNRIEAELSSSLALLFQSRNLFKVGFQIGSDLRRLASSYPHLKVFQEIESVVELSNIARKMIQKSFHPSLTRADTASLRRLCITVLGYDLSKTEQISNWARRPLTVQQIQYASLDSAVSPHILQTLLNTVSNKHRSTASILLNKDYTSFVSSWRFTVFTMRTESDIADMTLVINHLKASRVTGDSYVVTQSWITGHTPLNPPALSVNSFVDKGGVLRVLPHSIQLFGPQISDNDWIGELIIKRNLGLSSKDKCLNLLLKNSYSASVQPGIYRDAKLDYNTRSGYVELKDSVIIFVNMPKVNDAETPLNPFWQKYPNSWQNNGKALTWYLREYEWDQGKTELAQKLLSTTSGFEKSSFNQPVATTLLFIRHDRNDYSFYGRCSVSTSTSVHKSRSDSLVQLYLHLNDFYLLHKDQQRADAIQDDNSTTILSN